MFIEIGYYEKVITKDEILNFKSQTAKLRILLFRYSIQYVQYCALLSFAKCKIHRIINKEWH